MDMFGRREEHMSKSTEAMREHFNKRLVPHSKTIMEERDRVNSMIDAVERDIEGMTYIMLRMRRLLLEKCEEPHEPWHGKPCESCAENGSSDCPKIIAMQMRECGIEVDE